MSLTPLMKLFFLAMVNTVLMQGLVPTKSRIKYTEYFLFIVDGRTAATAFFSCQILTCCSRLRRICPPNRSLPLSLCWFHGRRSLNQPTSSAIKEGDTVLYTPTAEGEKEVRARVVKVHPDAGGAHYTILPHVKDAKEKNTTAERVSKVRFSSSGFDRGGTGNTISGEGRFRSSFRTSLVSVRHRVGLAEAPLWNLSGAAGRTSSHSRG